MEYNKMNSQTSVVITSQDVLDALVRVGGPPDSPEVIDKITDMNLDSLGYDSLARLGAIAELESLFGVKASSEADQAKTIRDLIEAFVSCD
jgi:acyl carrier protein